MSLGLRLIAQIPNLPSDPAGVLTQVESWIKSDHARMQPRTRHEVVDSNHSLFCNLHPAAEEIEFTLVSPSELVISANTTTVGPGYHVYLTSLLKNLAHELDAIWDVSANQSDDFFDETGFFFSGDLAGLKGEMTLWLSALANTFFDGSLNSGDRPASLCLPPNPHFMAHSHALTPLGPRDLGWLKQTASDGNNGTDFFAWWEPGFNAEYYLRRALTQMWTEVRWRLPANEAEERVLEDIAASLFRAFELDPELVFPWAEWQQVLHLLNRGGVEAKLVNSRVHGAPSIGYRRNNVQVTLPGGWRIEVPGSFSDFESDSEGDLCAVDPPREIWFTAFRVDNSTPRKFRSAKEQARNGSLDLVIYRDDYFAQARISQETRGSEDKYFVLHSSNLAFGMRSVCTILFSNPIDREWAINTWKRLKPPPARRS
jgi:hypothetical protein